MSSVAPLTAFSLRKRSKRSLWRALRTGALALHAVLFLSTWTILPLADAAGDGASVRSPHATHVEEQGGRGCPRVHNDATCQICRVLSSVGSAERPAAMLPAAKNVSVAPSACAQPAFTLQWLSQARTRAPPAF